MFGIFKKVKRHPAAASAIIKADLEAYSEMREAGLDIMSDLYFNADREEEDSRWMFEIAMLEYQNVTIAAATASYDRFREAYVIANKALQDGIRATGEPLGTNSKKLFKAYPELERIGQGAFMIFSFVHKVYYPYLQNLKQGGPKMIDSNHELKAFIKKEVFNGMEF